MTKILTLLLFISTSIYGQTFSGALTLSVYEKTKGLENRKAVSNQSITVTLRDSIHFTLTTNAEGYTPTIKNLSTGNYTVKVVMPDCQAQEVKDIIIGEGKTAYVGVLLTCSSYINSLTKKEKKKLGYK